MILRLFLGYRGLACFRLLNDDDDDDVCQKYIKGGTLLLVPVFVSLIKRLLIALLGLWSLKAIYFV